MTKRIVLTALLAAGLAAGAALMATKERVLGHEHPDPLLRRNNLALALPDTGQHHQVDGSWPEGSDWGFGTQIG